MNLSAIFIRRPIMTILVMVAILFFGILCYGLLPVSDLPNVDYPTIQVTASYPGANPETMANNVTAPLEKKFTTVQGVQSLSSTSDTGSTTIVLQFNLDKSIDSAAQDVQSAINQASQQLPQNLPYAPTYTKVSPSATPIMFLLVTSPTLTLGDIYDYANSYIGERISLINGVSQVLTYGYPYAVRVQVDPQKLNAKQIGLDQIATVIQDQNVYLPTGTMYGGKTEYTINADGQINVASGYNPMVMKNVNGATVRLQDVGIAFDSTQNDKFMARYINNQANINLPDIVLAVQKEPTSNAVAIIDQIKELLPTLIKGLPASLQVNTYFDKSEFIMESVHDVQFTVFVAFALVVVVIFVYLGKPMNTLIPILALPMSIIGTFIFMYMFKFNIDILSLLAISLSIGFLVDDAIVVLENIERHVELGKTPMEAALEGSKEICFTILSMTLCLISVFIPMLFMGGVVGRIFFEFAVTIVTAVLLSGAISLSLTPMLCSRLIPPRSEGNKKTKVQLFSERFNTFLLGYYERSLKWVLGHTKWVIIGGVASLVASVWAFQVLPKDFFPPDDLGFIDGFTQCADGTSTFQMIEYQKEATKIIQDDPAIEAIVTIGAYPQDNQGLFYVRLKPYDKRSSMPDVIHRLYKKLSSFPGLQAFFRPLPLINLQVGTTTSMGDYQYTMQSLKSDVLYKYGQLMYEKIKTLKGFTQVSSDLHISQPQININIERDKASLLNITANDIETALGWAFADSNLSPINEPDNQYYVIMEVAPEFYSHPDLLSQIYIRSSSHGNLVPLNEIAKITQGVGPLVVNHLNALPSVTITFNLDIPLGTALQELNQLAQEVLPSTVTGNVQGTASIFTSSFADLTSLLLVTIFVIYIILGILYENFFHPITVMTALPPAALGGLITLMLTNNTLSIYAFVGIILLLGIVLKNGIILIDFANEAIEKGGKTPREAIMHACLTRFRPILMTTLSALMGAVPIALGIGGMIAQSRRSLGLVIVGGLLFSQLLTLFLTPIVYIYLETLREYIDSKWTKRKA